MSDLRLSLDHTGSMVRDLAAGADRWRRLGFQLAPRSPQMGTLKPGEPMQPWATANHVAMFRAGYLELIGIHEPTRFNPWRHFMDRYEGIHIVALRCADADAAWAVLQARAPGLSPPIDRRRDAPYRGGTREMRFRNIFSRDEHYPEARFIVIEHQTPELLWQPELMVHANGAVALSEVVFVAADPAAMRQRIEAILGGPQPLGGGRVSVLDPARFQARYAGATPPPLPCAAAQVVAVEDLDAARRLLAGNGVALTTLAAGSLMVPAAETNGAVLELVPA
ncbi:MAG: VOC family protein [Alphaproteobacteria bacterium]|nr:VOC family protein [Alphaproteobacteria bacterium]